MKYLSIIESEIIRWQANIVENSTCFSRTHAHCDGTRRICKYIPKDSYASLWTLLHEIGHLETKVKGMTRAESENTAVKWQIARLKELGLPIKRKYLQAYKRYITRCYDRAVRRGMKKGRVNKSELMLVKTNVPKVKANIPDRYCIRAVNKVFNYVVIDYFEDTLQACVERKRSLEKTFKQNLDIKINVFDREKDNYVTVN